MHVRAEIAVRKGDRIAVKSERRFPGDYDMSKSIPGGRWEPNGKYWHYPLSMSTCRILREVYTDLLKIGPELTKWARSEVDKEDSLESMVKQYDTDLRLIPKTAPLIDKAMESRTYQRVGARFLAESRTCLLADEVSLGKTIQFLGGLHEAGLFEGNHLIVAPKAALETVWADEVHKWTDGSAFWMPEGLAKRHAMMDIFLEDDAPAKFLIINAEMLQTKVMQWCSKCELWEDDYFSRDNRKKCWPGDHIDENHKSKPMIRKQDHPRIFDIEWSSIAVDEAHKYLLGIESVSKKTQVAEGLTRLKTIDGAMKVGITGTPLKGKAMNFWSFFHWLRPKEFSSKWAFAENYLEITDNGFGKVIGDLRSDREAMLYRSLAGIMLRRTKAEVQPDLPDDDPQDRWVRMSPKQEKQYNELVAEGEVEMDIGSITTTGALAEFTRQKQWSFGTWNRDQTTGKLVPGKESPKLEFLLQEFRERGLHPDDLWQPDTDGFKHIIVSQFTSVLDFVADQLESEGIETMKITGAITAKKRAVAVRRFQDKNDNCRVLLLNTMAGGAALTLDAWCDEMWILDETWVRDDLVQVEGRIRNRDVEKRVATRVFHYIRTKGTIEEEIAESGLSQEEFAANVMDRRRGMKIARREISV